MYLLGPPERFSLDDFYAHFWVEMGVRKLLARLLVRRFGPVPHEFVLRFAHADDEQIECWSERVLTAQSLEEVFDDED